MIESGYYPQGAEFDKYAPWNEEEQKEMKFNVCVTSTLSKRCKLSTTHYSYVVEPFNNFASYETDEVDWEDEYNNEYFGIEELLKELSKMAGEKLRELPKSKDYNTEKKRRKLQCIIASCKGWETDSFYVNKE